MKKLHLTQISLLVTILIILVVGAIIFLSIGNFEDNHSRNRAEEIRGTVISYVAQCYAMEGLYPNNLDYLEDNYGLQLDRDKYIYHYEMFATNIFPDVQVFVKEKAGD